MDNLLIASTPSTPEIDFRFDEHVLTLKGEAYPENAAAYWSGIITSLKEYLSTKHCERPIVVNVELVYFNSSSTKMLFAFFDLLNEKARQGTPVVLNWYHHEDDDSIFEFGQELKEDFSELTFNDHKVTD